MFIFPGGSLNVRQDYEYLRNSVYNLVNEENLDGCISWSSTLQSPQSADEFEHFHRSFESLPLVTLGYKLPGHPCVKYDAYNGMKEIVTHCIRIHGARKIAFLRGPVFNQSTQSRFIGYCDALLESGIQNIRHPLLITDPFNLSEGAAAAAQLYQHRSLIPGRDFDTLVGSSDLMAMEAMDYFANHGYHVPADYHAVGFSNSGESRITESPLSTVDLSYAQLSKESFKILYKIMSRKKHKQDVDILLNTEVIIRESCGCVNFLNTGGRIPEFDAVQHAVNSLIHEDQSCFFPVFKKVLINYFKAGGEPDIVLRLLADLKITGLNLPALYHNVLSTHQQLASRTGYEKDKYNTVLNSLKCDLLGTRDRYSLIRNLARHLSRIEIKTAAIVLFKDEKTSVFAGGFSGDGILPVKNHHFPARFLVPPGIKPIFNNGIFLVQPLFIENRSLGYFIHSVPIYDGKIFEELRSAVSYALKGIFLLEETLHAKQIAEQAERAKTEFLQTLENSLYDPFQGVIEKLDALGKNIALTAESGKEALLFDVKELISFVSSKVSETSNLMDFTLAKIDELTLRISVFDIEVLLPKIGTYPLLTGDTARLAQCFSLIRKLYAGGYSAEMTYGGLSITFISTRTVKTRKIEKARQFSMLFAERIILKHGGNFSLKQDHCTITLPWPTLTGQELSKNPVKSRDHVLVLSDTDFLPANFFSLPRIYDTVKASAGRTAFIVWNASGAGPGDLAKVAGFRHKNEYAAVPFLCYGMPVGPSGFLASAATLIDAVDFVLKSPKKGAILFIGSPGYWENDFIKSNIEKISIDSITAIHEILEEIKPLLVVFNTIDIIGAAEVRRHPLTSTVPILMIFDKIKNTADIYALSQYSRLIICHSAVVSSLEFQARIQTLLGGEELLPRHTGILVKKAIQYFDQHAESNISRWKLADTVNVNEDYLTRIFRSETGLSLWDYLNRLRIYRAADLLRQTDDTIQNIAFRSGFHDHTYFCRVFRKIYGFSPGQLREQKKSE